MTNKFFQFFMNRIFEPIRLKIRHMLQVRALIAEARKIIIIATQELESGDMIIDFAAEGNFDVFALNANHHYEHSVKLYRLAAAKFAEAKKLRLDYGYNHRLDVKLVPKLVGAKTSSLKVREKIGIGQYANH
jgi:RAB protein geranylgeranyltransferase component A